jgi:hypothetical protein
MPGADLLQHESSNETNETHSLTRINPNPGVGVEKQLQARKLLHISFLGVDAWSTVSPWTKEMVSPRPPE